jgi:uncharacterized protein YgfB (UPF0149 family)
MVSLGLLREEAEVDFISLQKLVTSLQKGSSTGEVHGLICGFLAAGSRPTETDWNNILNSWFDMSVPESNLASQIMPLATLSLEQLNDEQLSFQLLLPDDERPLSNRLREISGWCRGFLHGFGLAGNYRQQDLSEDAAELLADIAEISKISDQPDDSDTEGHYVEILEYLRVGTILLFTEHGHPTRH